MSSLPRTNPIDYGWFNRGTPIDWIDTVEFTCGVCSCVQPHEKFKIAVGVWYGLGAPTFVAGFTKRSSTKGKFGGKRGLVVQCTSCNSLWPFDESGSVALEKGGLPTAGLPSGPVRGTNSSNTREGSAESGFRKID